MQKFLIDKNLIESINQYEKTQTKEQFEIEDEQYNLNKFNSLLMHYLNINKIYQIYIKNIFELETYHQFHARIQLNQYLLLGQDLKSFSTKIFSQEFLLKEHSRIVREAHKIEQEIKFKLENNFSFINYHDKEFKKYQKIFKTGNKCIAQGSTENDSIQYQELHPNLFIPQGQSVVQSSNHSINQRISKRLVKEQQFTVEGNVLSINTQNCDVKFSHDKMTKTISSSVGLNKEQCSQIGPIIKQSLRKDQLKNNFEIWQDEYWENADIEFNNQFISIDQNLYDSCSVSSHQFINSQDFEKEKLNMSQEKMFNFQIDIQDQ